MGEWTKRYKYTKEIVQENILQSGGVYRLLYHTEDKYYVLYVGKSNNLGRRLLEHLSSSEPDECIKKHLKNYDCYFRYIVVDIDSERERIEKQQIEEYSPSCNNKEK